MRKGSPLKEVQGGKEGARRETRREKENGKNEEKVRKSRRPFTWNIVGYLKPSTERTYLLTNKPRTRMTMKIEAAPIFILATIWSHPQITSGPICF